MDNIRILIVEDNLSFAMDLELFLNELKHEILGIADNSAEALERINVDFPDLILMDINIKGRMNGIEVAKAIESLKIPTIFITAHKDTITLEAALDTNAVNYLVKPFDLVALEAAIKFAFRKEEIEEDKETYFLKGDTLFLKKGSSYNRVLVTDIDYVLVEGNYSIVYSKGKKYPLRMSMRKFLNKLEGHQFIKTHKSCAVRIEAVENVNFSENTITILGNTLPLGRTYRADFLKQFNLFQ